MMNIADMLNPSATTDMLSSPLTHSSTSSSLYHQKSIHGKPRSRFSELEDAIICDGVAKGSTWGQISNQLPHRKRATCFNRYRTLQGIRKSRKRSQESRYSSTSPSLPPARSNSVHSSPITTPITLTPMLSPSSSSPSSSTTWTPTSPCDLFSPYPAYSSNQNDSFIRKLSIPSISSKDTLPPIYCPIPQHPQHHQYYKHHFSRPIATRLPSLA